MRKKWVAMWKAMPQLCSIQKTWLLSCDDQLACFQREIIIGCGLCWFQNYHFWYSHQGSTIDDCISLDIFPLIKCIAFSIFPWNHVFVNFYCWLNIYIYIGLHISNRNSRHCANCFVLCAMYFWTKLVIDFTDFFTFFSPAKNYVLLQLKSSLHIVKLP